MPEITSSQEVQIPDIETQYNQELPQILYEVFNAHEQAPEAGVLNTSLEGFAHALNTLTADRVHATASLDYMFFVDGKGRLMRYVLGQDQTVSGQFLGFRVEETDEGKNLVADMLINITPESSPGIMREEAVRLWKPEAQALCWLNFGPNPRRRINFWRRVLRTT